LFVLTTLVMEACRSSLGDHVAAEMEKRGEIKRDFDSFTGA
jgi:hypothetical protein